MGVRSKEDFGLKIYSCPRPLVPPSPRLPIPHPLVPRTSSKWMIGAYILRTRAP